MKRRIQTSLHGNDSTTRSPVCGTSQLDDLVAIVAENSNELDLHNDRIISLENTKSDTDEIVSKLNKIESETKDLHYDVKDNNRRIASLENNNHDHPELVSKLNKVETETKDMHYDVKDHNRRIAHLEAHGNSVSHAEITSMVTRIQSNETRSQDTATKLAVLEANISAPTDLRAVEQKIANVESSVDATASRVSNMELDVAHIPSFKDRIATMENKLDNLNLDVPTEVTDDITELFKGQSLNSIEIDRSTKRLDVLESIEGGVADLTELNTKIDELKSGCDLSETRISALESVPVVDVKSLTDSIKANSAEIGSVSLDVADVAHDIKAHNIRIMALETVVPETGGSEPTKFTDLTDTPSVLVADKFVKVNASGDSLELVDAPTVGESAPIGFTDLTDTPDTLVANKYVKVNESGDGLEFVNAPIGGDAEVDLTEVNAKIDDLTSKLGELGEHTVGKFDDHATTLSAHDEAITTLQAATGGVSRVPTKWYILPLGGQSNMTGFGEIVPRTPEPNPRLMQLGVQDSYEIAPEGSGSDNTCKASTGYGDKYRTYRPMEDSNLKLIPAVPCLDSTHSVFWQLYTSAKAHVGGLVGTGYYLANLLLKYIPEDYGILIVNGTRGSAGFGDENAIGTYDEATMRCSHSSRRISPTSPIGRAFYERTKHALELNPENVLLPIIWFQGESDGDPAVHYTRFKEYAKWFRDSLNADGFAPQLPTKSIHDFRWLCFGSTKILLGENIEGNDYYGTQINYNSAWSYLRSMYDNYAYLAEDPEFKNPHSGESQIVSIRCDIDQNGKFYETVVEELAAAGGIDSVASSQPDWHFSSSVVMSSQPQLITGIMSTYGKCLPIGNVAIKQPRKVHSSDGYVFTDGVVFDYPTNPCQSFNPESDPALLLHHKFADDHVDGKPTFISPAFSSHGLTSSGSAPTYEDSDLGKVVKFTSATKGMVYTISTAASVPEIDDYSMSVVVKIDESMRTATERPCILSGDTNNTPIVTINEGAVIVYPRYGVNSDTNSENLMVNKSYVGAWNGQWSDWQRITVSYSKRKKLVNVYVNGCNVGSIKITDHIANQGKFYLGNYRGTSSRFVGLVSDLKIFGRCLSHEEVAAL